MSHQNQVNITTLQKTDVANLVRENQEKLKTTFVVVDEKDHEVLVRDGSQADMRFRESPPGSCMPTGTHTVDGDLYRTYMVSPEILGT